MNEIIDLIFQETKDRLEAQLLSMRQVATKFNFLLAFNSIIIASVLQGFLSLETQKSFPFLLLLAIFLLFMSAFYDMRGLSIQNYRRDPDPKKLFEKYRDSDENETKKILVQNYIESFESNTKKLRKNNKIFKYSVKFSSGGLLLIFMFLAMGNIISIWETITKIICQR